MTDKSKCVVGPADAQTSQGRDPFAKPGEPGNRWLKFGCSGEIPVKYRTKVQKALALVYQLGKSKNFTQEFDRLVSGVARDKSKTLTYLDALNAITLNLADTSTDTVVQQEMKDASDAKKADPTYRIEGGFTVGRTGQVYVREFALKDWTVEEIASLISHEAAHVAGAPADMLTEVVLVGLDKYGYRRHE